MKYVIGTDEVGFGCWAGDLLVCGAAVPEDWDAFVPDSKIRVKDSKKMTDGQMMFVYNWASINVKHVVEVVSPQEIDQRGARKALIAAHQKVIDTLQAHAKERGWEYTTIADGNLPLTNAKSVPRADDLYPAVSLASCIAKHLRDLSMENAAKLYPSYGFGRHHGYGVPEHQAALDQHGPCPIHRMSYSPVRRAAAQHGASKQAWEID